MKVQIRHGVFETNSSSTHCIVILNKQMLNDWKKGKLLYKWNTNEFKPVENVTEDERYIWTEDDYKALWCSDDVRFMTYSEFFQHNEVSELNRDSSVLDGVEVHAISVRVGNE